MSFKRHHYHLTKAAEILECSVDDLIHLAAHGDTRLGILSTGIIYVAESAGQPERFDRYDGFVYLDRSALQEAERTERFTISLFVDCPDGRSVTCDASVTEKQWSVEELLVHENELQALQQLFARPHDSAEHPYPTFASQGDDEVVDPNAKDRECADLFDPVTVAYLENLFPAQGQWQKWSDRAKRNGLDRARESRGKFNLYRAGLWALDRGIQGLTRERLMKKLRHELPDRSKDKAYLLTGEFE